MQRVLVTGAGGFIGSHLALALHRRGHFVRGVDIKWDGYMEEEYCSERMTADLRIYENAIAATKGVDWVFQLAADMGGIAFITNVSADVMHNNSLINMNIIRASAASGVKRYFFASSACVYPEYRQLTTEVPPLREEDAYPAAPDTAYGWEKLFSENVCSAYARDYGLGVRIGRYHNIYGPRGTWRGGREKAPAALCRKVAEASENGTLEIWGDGKQTRSFCYIDDCVVATMKLMESDHGQPINIGSHRLVSIGTLADMIVATSGKKLARKFDTSAPQGVRGRNADLTLARHVLGWEPEVNLEEGLARTYRWIEHQVVALQLGEGVAVEGL